jgi:deoxyribodipyrimidine photo-lyase
VFYGKPLEIIQQLCREHQIRSVYCNHDYEPQARRRDEEIAQFAQQKGFEFCSFKDQVIFEKDEVLTDARKPYTVYTPYKRKWLASLTPDCLKSNNPSAHFASLRPCSSPQSLLSLRDLGFSEPERKLYEVPQNRAQILSEYAEQRNFPAQAGTTRLGLYLRFGTVSVRELAREGQKSSELWLSELIWREFFMQILYHFPRVEKESFRTEYEKVAWRNSEVEFDRWCQGQTGYPIVDAGMRELNQTGFMHNRVRMITASFLTKHLLMHWLKGERYFASQLMDFDLSANNGNWQWAAGTGCDAAPYFRVFNPETQMEKFDPDLKYVKKWVPELGSSRYPQPMVDHRLARQRALDAFQTALKGKTK